MWLFQIQKESTQLLENLMICQLVRFLQTLFNKSPNLKMKKGPSNYSSRKQLEEDSLEHKKVVLELKEVLQELQVLKTFLQ